MDATEVTNEQFARFVNATGYVTVAEAREFAYAEKNNLSLEAAKKNGFTVVNIKSDWQTIFASAPVAVAEVK